ncbi:MAG: lspA [Alphaproteobacteria bacterium]|nr:lspA [Alphaproteobacteria bacterium]
MNWRAKGILLALGVILADQLSKWVVVTQFLARMDNRGFGAWLVEKAGRAPFASEEINAFLNIVMVWNPGVSFGMLQTDSALVVYGLSAMAIIVAIGFMVWLWREPKPLRGWSIGLIVGGALGNVWDRLRFGAVVDFIDLHAGSWHWPAFNIADSAVSIGIILLLIETFFFAENRRYK